METTKISLPVEVKELAIKVSEQKQAEVNTVLNQIFTGTADWEKQVEAIEIKDINDRMSINLADAARKNVKQARLAAEKIFDAKRDEVQQIKAEYDLEDKLWLKAKQVMQIKFKAIEEKAEWKAKFVERYETEQKELRTQLRIEKVKLFNPEVNRIEIENMSDEMFSVFATGLEKTYNDRIAAEKKIEEDRIAKEKAEAERIEKQRLDNIRLQEEAEAREKQIEKERKEAKEIQDKKDAAIAKERDEAEKERKALADKAQEEAEAREKLQAKIQSDKDEAERIKHADIKAKKDADKKAKLAPDKEKLLAFGQALNDVPRPEIKAIEAVEIMARINGLMVKLNNYILEQAENL